MEIISRYFPDLTTTQLHCFEQLLPLYSGWNSKVNVISRKDIGHLYERHVLHSLGIAKVIAFRPGTRVVDIGTGGGFPGIPLAILFPEVHFHLVDSIGKKIAVVREIASSLGLQNVTSEKCRAESLEGSYDFVVSRAVTALPDFVRWTRHLVSARDKYDRKNGILYIKGGDFTGELKSLDVKARVYPLSRFFNEDFFLTKSVVHLSW